MAMQTTRVELVQGMLLLWDYQISDTSAIANHNPECQLNNIILIESQAEWEDVSQWWLGESHCIFAQPHPPHGSDEACLMLFYQSQHRPWLLHLEEIIFITLLPSSTSQRSKVNANLLVCRLHADCWVEATPCYSNFTFSYCLAISCEENLCGDRNRFQSGHS